MTSTLTFVIPDETKKLLDAIVYANTHKSKGEIIREALELYLGQLDIDLKEAALKMLEIRKSLKEGNGKDLDTE